MLCVLGAAPQIVDYKSEVVVTEGMQVTLRVTFIGTPKPAVFWTFKGKKVEADNSTETELDGSLFFICVERKHAGW